MCLRDTPIKQFQLEFPVLRAYNTSTTWSKYASRQLNIRSMGNPLVLRQFGGEIAERSKWANF